MSKIRTFVAVEISPKTRESAGRLIDRLQSCDSGIRWVDLKRLHLTLNFLGEVDERDLHKVCQAVGDASGSIPEFVLSCRGVGAFPDLKRPRTVWIGVDQGSQEISDLQRATEDTLSELGFPKERRKYHPHLTIGRARRGTANHKQLTELMTQLEDIELGTTSLSEVVVFSSELEPTGPVYQALSRCPLGVTL